MASLKDKISFILYEQNRIPRYHQISQGSYSFFLYAPVSLFLLSALVFLGSFFYVKNVEQYVRSQEPEIIEQLKTENLTLSAKSFEYQSTIDSLTERLTSDTSDSAMGALSLFSTVKGQKDSTNPAQILIQDIKIERENQNAFIEFNIINTTNDNEKLAGYIHVFMTDGNIFKHYPESNINSESFHLSFNHGESFATTRFRPVQVKFKNITSKSVIFKIIIFNRVGDLIHQQQIKQEVQ